MKSSKHKKIMTNIKRIIKHPSSIIIYLGSKNIIQMDDKTFLERKFYEKFNRKLNLDNPQSFNEKLQWLKLNDRKDIYTTMADKYEAKKYISDILGEKYIIPTLGIYNNFDEINFDELPNQFVIKCTHDSGSVVICKNKNELDLAKVKNKINNSLKRNYYYHGREWPYKNVKPRIIIEKYMASNNEKLQDYKFYCFNGQPKFLSTSRGMDNHSTARLSFMDMEYNLTEFSREDYELLLNTEKPKNFEEMKKIAKQLSKDIPFVRVDLYEIKGKTYFGELTFYPSSGFIKFRPKEYDQIIGDMLKLEK